VLGSKERIVIGYKHCVEQEHWIRRSGLLATVAKASH